MLHLQSIGKTLTRFVLLLLLMQFGTPVFATVSAQDNNVKEKISHQHHHDAVIALSIFLKGNSEEKSEENEKSHIPTLLNLSFHAVALNQSHTSIFSQFGNERLAKGQLFKLHCIFLI
jgi:hypothetical protein